MRDKRESDNVGVREVMRSLAKSCWAPELTGRLLNVGGKLAWPGLACCAPPAFLPPRTD